MIAPVSDVGEVTARIFGFNETERLDKRMILQQDIARYPSKAALRRMAGQTG